jgi:hypothetical protein
LQKALDKFKQRDFAVLAVNLSSTQREFVVPLLKAMKCDFVPLEGTWEWAEKTYGVTGTPANLLIDANGRIVFRPVVHDEATRLILERQIEALLDRQPAVG